MYELLAIKEYEATRDLFLQNVETKTINMCFDDSDVVSEKNNFDFMEIGKKYDCKIVLFGDTNLMNIGEQVECFVLDSNVKVGTKSLVKVRVDTDVYYVYKNSVFDHPLAEKFMFEYTRKDLIQVDNVTHEDLLV